MHADQLAPNPPKPGKQARSERTHSAILDAAEAVIAQRGYAAASINEISQHAGVTSGALYGRFHGKEDLLNGIFERHRERLHGAFEALCGEINTGTLSLRGALERAMQAMVWLYRDNATLVRATNEAAAASPSLKIKILDFNRQVCAELYRSLQRYANEVKHPQPALAVKLGHEAGTRLLRAAILNGEVDYRDLASQGITIDDNVLATQAARIMEAYLRSNDA
ncbi:MAG: TetR family transcriptional regulator [Massilia sp.]